MYKPKMKRRIAESLVENGINDPVAAERVGQKKGLVKRGQEMAWNGVAHLPKPILQKVWKMRRAYHKASDAYNVGKITGQMDDFYKNDLASYQNDVGESNDHRNPFETKNERVVRQLSLRNNRNKEASDTSGDMDGSRMAYSQTLDSEDYNNKWARLGRGTLFHKDRREEKRTNRRMEWQDHAIINNAHFNKLNETKEAIARGESGDPMEGDYA